MAWPYRRDMSKPVHARPAPMRHIPPCPHGNTIRFELEPIHPGPRALPLQRAAFDLDRDRHNNVRAAIFNSIVNLAPGPHDPAPRALRSSSASLRGIVSAALRASFHYTRHHVGVSLAVAYASSLEFSRFLLTPLAPAGHLNNDRCAVKPWTASGVVALVTNENAPSVGAGKQ